MTHANTILKWMSLCLLTFGITARADIKVGVIDMQKAIQESKDGKKAKQELESEFNKKKKDLQKHESDIKKMGEDFEKRSMAMNEDARMKKQAELQKEMRGYQELAAKSEMEINKRQADLTKPIVDKLRKIIDDIAQKEGFTVILEKSDQTVMWAKKEVDLTDRVIKAYDGK